MTPVALVTGGQRGIGLGVAQALVQANFRVALVARSSHDSPDVRSALDLLGSSARYYRHDILETGRIDALVDTVEGDLGPLTTLVSNAGVPARVRGDMLKITPDNFDFVLGVNLRGTFFLAQEVGRRMVTRESPHYRSMIFVTSVSADAVSIQRAEYCISKAGTAMTAKLFAVRLAPLGVGVFELRPGIIETSMTEVAKASYSLAIEDGLVPALRWGSPSDIGGAIVPFATGQMEFATGAVIPIDGGLSIARL